MKEKIYLWSTKQNRRLAKNESTSRKHKDKHYIIITTLMVIRAAIATINIPRGNANRGVKAQKIVTACTRNPNVAVTPANIVIYNQDIVNYNAATTATRAALWLDVKNDLDVLRGLVQNSANANPALSVSIVEGAGFDVKKVSIHQKNKDDVANGVDSGTIDLVGVTVKGRCLHDWWYSADGIHFTRMRPTLDATTTMKGLIPGEWAWFIHELITLKNPRGLGQIMKIMVK